MSPLRKVPNLKFLVDENVRLEAAEYLAAQGHDVKRVPQGIKNGEVIKLALKDKRILVTGDVHFSNILMHPPRKYPGIIRIKIHPPSAAKELTALKKLLFMFSSPSDFSKRLFVLEENNFRARR